MKAGTFKPKVEAFGLGERGRALRAQSGARQPRARRRSRRGSRRRPTRSRPVPCSRRRGRRRCRHRGRSGPGPRVTEAPGVAVHCHAGPRDRLDTGDATWRRAARRDRQLPRRLPPHPRGARRAERRQRAAGREPRAGRGNRGRGGRVAGDHRRRDRRGRRPRAAPPPLAAGASRAVLGRQRPAHGPALSPRRGAARARHPALLRAYPARPAPDRGQQRRARRAARARGRRLVRRLQGRADRRVGPRAGAAGAARRAGGRGEPRAGHDRARAPGSSPAAPSGWRGWASSPVARGA